MGVGCRTSISGKCVDALAKDLRDVDFGKHLVGKGECAKKMRDAAVAKFLDFIDAANFCLFFFIVPSVSYFFVTDQIMFLLVSVMYLVLFVSVLTKKVSN